MLFSLTIKLSILITLNVALITALMIYLGASNTVGNAIGGLSALLMSSVFINLYVTRPLNQLNKAMRLLEQGDFSTKLQINGSSQMKALSDSFNLMVNRVMMLVDSTAQQVFDMAQTQERLQHITELSNINRELEKSLAEVRLLNARQESIYLSAINALVTTIEASDEYTQGHSTRVTRYSLALAKRIGLAAERIKILEQAAILHDIGKIGIDKSILHKPGRLTEEEYAVMQQHPVIATNILRHIVGLSDVHECVERHHERFVGKGYPPLGIGGDDLLLEARILAITDTFDAMTSNRPYRRGLPLEKAISELSKNAGSQFDPFLVDHFITFLRESELTVSCPGHRSKHGSNRLKSVPTPVQSELPVTALIVQEDPLSCLIVRDYLERLGHRVETANTANHGMKLFAGCLYDLVLLDTDLPDHEAYTAARDMRRMEQRLERPSHLQSFICALVSSPEECPDEKTPSSDLNLFIQKSLTTRTILDIFDIFANKADRSTFSPIKGSSVFCVGSVI